MTPADLKCLANLGQNESIVVKLGFYSRNGEKLAELNAEVADNAVARQRGLSKRAELDPDNGMFFDRAASFWMRDVGFPLDIMFLDKQGSILDIQHMRVEPGPEYTLYRPRSSYACSAVETPAHWSELHGVSIGDRVRLC
jgi:uncharacterized protein